MDDWNALLRRQKSVVTWKQAKKVKKVKALAALVERGQAKRVHPGVYWVGEGSEVPWLQRVVAAMFWAGKGAVASHRTAARLHGLDGQESDVVQISIPHSRKRTGTEEAKS